MEKAGIRSVTEYQAMVDPLSLLEVTLDHAKISKRLKVKPDRRPITEKLLRLVQKTSVKEKNGARQDKFSISIFP